MKIQPAIVAGVTGASLALLRGCTTEPQPELGGPLAGVTSEQQARFVQGSLAFQCVFDPTNGLGPVFNANSCAQCHEDPVVGGVGDEVDQSQLIGHTMGGRHRCWRFQSPDQIKELTIKDQTEDARRLVCVVALRLQATNARAQYAAEARVEYTKTLASSTFNRVGLLSIKRIE